MYKATTFSFYFFLLMCLIVPPSVAAQVVDIPDPNIRVAIAEQLGKASGAIITTADMANLTSLEAHTWVHDLTGLESATNLTRLLIQGPISDLSPLAGLTQLNHLVLYSASPISDLSPLAGLTPLNHLELRQARNISDLSPLAGLTQLNHLELRQARKLSDLSPLVGLTQLNHLELYHASNLSDLSPLAGLTQLNHLSLSSTAVSDLSFLEGLTNLRRLYLHGTSVSDLSPLMGLTQLNGLGFSSTPVSDLSPLAGLTQLNYLSLNRTSVSDLSPLAGLTQLNYLSLNRTSVSDLSFLEGLTNLRRLYLDDNNISDLSLLEGLNRLIDLELKGNLLSYQSIHTHIPTLQSRGVSVKFDSRSVADLLNISGVITASNNTLTIEVRDSLGRAFAGVPVTFTVVSGGGILSVTNTTADEQGRAQSILTLGDGKPNSVEASVTGTALAIILSDTVVPEVKLPDPNLRAAVETLLGKALGATITTADMARLTHLHARNIDISDLTGLESATNLTYLSLNDNNISDISPLVANTGLGTGDHVHLWGNPLSSLSLNDYIPTLRGKGVRVIPDEEAEPYTVGMVYFLPNDSQPRPNVDAQIDELIKEIQDDLANWMEAYGFGRKTFTFQADATGKAVVHHVNGRFNQAYYIYDPDHPRPFLKVWNELDEHFASQRTIYVCLIDGGAGHSGNGGGSSLSGRAVIRSDPSGNFHTGVVAHELMHTFGLHHSRDHKYQFGDASEWDLACRTEWLDVHRYLNPTQRSHDVSAPSVRMLPPSFVSPPNTIRLRFEVEDDDGLHQAQLLRNTHDAGVHMVVACKQLTGTHSTVEFVTTALLPKDTDVTLAVIDVHGNFSLPRFSIDVASMIPPPQVVSVPDAHLADVLRREFDLAPGDPITSHRLLLLQSLSAGPLIADLTGIDSAINLRELALGDNSILDFSPLEGLTKLHTLGLSRNSVWDPSFLAGLTNLRTLVLFDSAISDLSPLVGLKNLRYLELRNNSISDLSPLVGNTQLGFGTYILVDGNPLSYQSIHTHIPILQSRGIIVSFDNQAHKALLKISGGNQTDAADTVLSDPFVVEVKDENGSKLQGVEVRFTVTAGGGTLSVTSTNSDSNGRAETTLTLGPNLGTNTVEVSAAGIAVPVTFNAIADDPPSEYLMTVPSGVSLIHVPLKVTAVDGIEKTIESIADLYDALGGANVVTYLVTYDSQHGDWLSYRNWFSYLVPSDRDGSADRKLTDDMGIIASLKAPMSVRLSGKSLGTYRNSAITLKKGLNLVGLPLRDSRITRVSDLLAFDGIRGNVSTIIVNHNGEFRWVGRADDPGDIEITGGQAFIMAAQHAAAVAISGTGWTNDSGAAAPPVTVKGIEVGDTTPVLGLRGSVVDEEAGLKGPNFRVTVKNHSTDRAVATITTPDAGGYRATVVDIETGRAARVGDVLEISAQSPNPFIGVEPLRHTVTTDDVKRSLIQFEMVAYEIPVETELLHNYPNPFNPETWIPYRLAEDAFVTLTIYDSKGQVVRTLEIGHRIAAAYESQSKAIYWDGKNDVGEQVASGIYFYRLSAGDYSATRKMVILK